MYLADTALFVVDVFDLDPVTGILASRRRFLDFSEAQVWPDGMTVDDEGMLWVALGRAGAVHRYRADGTLNGVVEIPTTNPTSVAFGDIDGADLYITTSWLDLDADSRAAQPLAGAIFRCRPGVTGPPSPRYTGIPASPEPLPEGDVDARPPRKATSHDRANGPVRSLWRSDQPPADARRCPAGRGRPPATGLHDRGLGSRWRSRPPAVPPALLKGLLLDTDKVSFPF